MMRISVRFFAGLREQLEQAELELSLPADATVAQVWEQAAKGAVSGPVLAARNMEYVDFSARLHDGDEVAFFPPVTGGGR